MASARRRKAGGKSKGWLATWRGRLGLAAPATKAAGKRRKACASPQRLVWIVVIFALGLLAGAIGLDAVGERDEGATIAEPAAASVSELAPVPAVEAEEPGIGDIIAALPDPIAEPEPAPDPVVTTATPSVELASVALPATPTPSSGAWLANALPPVDTQGRAMIAIVIDDVGVDRPNADAAIALPAPVTLSLMSYADDLPSLAATARAQGHELMLHLPMQPLDAGVDAGTYSLRIDQSPAELRAALDWALARFDGYIGVNNHMGSAFTRAPAPMAVVLSELHQRGLMFLDSRTIADSAGGAIAARLGLPHLDRDIFLDNDPSPAAIAAQLAELERIALEKGSAIGIGHPYPSTIAALQRWISELTARGIVIVPVSTILRKKLGLAG
ncbi:MAG: divergent polysaccharide deacetylase family protein [Rhodospirillaceae bacterium]|nr:divergent polysaccharide deacetylase family protein [Rhodospirillaceae bacterium]